MDGQFERTALLFGEKAVEKLRRARVIIFGIGGVGGYVTEALARAGVGALELVDSDRVSVSNINRQIIALHSTVGMLKVDAAEMRIHDICPDTEVVKHNCFYLPETADSFDFKKYDYVVDAIDTVAGKLEIVRRAYFEGIPVISSMGAGNKMDPTMLRVADIYDTSVCPLARVMRRELKKAGVKKLKVVYSTETPIAPRGEKPEPAPGAPRRDTPGSNSFVPPTAGLIIAGEVVKDIMGA